MKKIITPVLIFALLLTSCAATENKSDKLAVYSSFYAADGFVKLIGGEKTVCHSLAPLGSEPHDFEPSAKDIAKLSEADVFVYNGLGIDEWAEDVADTLPDTVITLKLSDVLDDNVIVDGDPHIWLSNTVAKAELDIIAGRLSEADPANASYYENNRETYSKKLDELYGEYRLAGLEGKKLFVTHGAYGYLCADFGMEQVALEGVSGDSDPSPAQTARIVDEMKASGAKCVFYDPLEGDKTAKAVASEAGVEALPLYTFEGDAEHRDYIEIMELNLEQLKKGL